MSKLAEFLRGGRPDDVALFLADSFVDDAGTLADHGEAVEGGVVIVVAGDAGRSAFSTATGMDAMAFARQAMGQDGHVHADLTGGDCPNDEGGDHHAEFVFAFAEEQHEDVGGLYAEGDVVHAYVQCSCGTAYSDRWVAGDR